MSWWNAKYKNGHGEYEITFASKDYEKAKVVEKVCQAIIDKRIKSPDELPPFLSGKGANVLTNAQRIRSMTDEELAAKIGAFCETSECRASNGAVCPMFADCPRGHIGASWIDWLKQHYEMKGE